MKSKTLVSGVIIFLNEERFIREAIESVFAQTYDNWELLLVDDGSTDASTQIALWYVERYPEKVRYLKHPGHQNRGKEASRNLGLRHAGGEYIGFLDADDVWLPHALQQQVKVLSSYPEAGMIYGATQYWFSWTGKPEDTQRDFVHVLEEHGAKPNTVVELPTWLTIYLRAGGAAPCICSTLLRRELVQSVGGFEERFRGQFEDQALFVKVGLQAPVLVADECWSKYRQHPDSSWILAQELGEHHSARLFFFEWIASYLFEQGVKNPEVWKLVQEKRCIMQVITSVQERERMKAIRGILALLWYHPQAFALALRGLVTRVRVRRWLRFLRRLLSSRSCVYRGIRKG
jgi:glycosyltransferase involved in cell wall biosynthesis